MTKRLDPEIKALRAINRALEELSDPVKQRRSLEWTLAHRLRRHWVNLPPFATHSPKPTGVGEPLSVSDSGNLGAGPQ